MKIRDRIRELRRVRAGDLLPNPKNWREHPKAQREALQGLLAEIGYADALLARELPGGALQLVDGHLRRETTPEEMVPVLVLDVDEAEADKLLLSIDPLSAMATANEERLAALIKEVETNSEAVAAMLENLARDHGLPGADEDLIDSPPPEPLAVPVSQAGDLWILGEHRLLQGDSSKPDDLDRLLGGAQIQLVNTDPPYNVKVEPRSNNAFVAGETTFHPVPENEARAGRGVKATTKKMRAKDRPLANDCVSDEEFQRLLDAWFGNMARVLVPGRGFYIWGGYANCANYPPVLARHGMYFSQSIIWVKEHPVLTRKDYMGNHEWCFYGWREGAAHQFFGPNNATDVWSVKKVNPQSMIHLTEKPVELAARAMLYSSRPGENVLDLFGGSGSTLIAAEQNKRRAFLMEIDGPYTDVIIRRWQKLAGRDAALEGTGKTWREVAAQRGVEIKED